MIKDFESSPDFSSFKFDRLSFAHNANVLTFVLPPMFHWCLCITWLFNTLLFGCLIHYLIHCLLATSVVFVWRKQDCLSVEGRQSDYPRTQYTDTLSRTQTGSVASYHTLNVWNGLSVTAVWRSYSHLNLGGWNIFPPVNLTLTRWPSYRNLT